MKINLKIEPVVGGYKITSGYFEGSGTSEITDEGFASTWKQVPTRIKAMLADITEPKS